MIFFKPVQEENFWIALLMWLNCLLAWLVNVSAFFLSSGSLLEISPMLLRRCGHLSSNSLRKAGPCVQRWLFKSASTVTPLDASSARFSDVSTYRHCLAVDLSNMAEMRLASYKGLEPLVLVLDVTEDTSTISPEGRTIEC